MNAISEKTSQCRGNRKDIQVMMMSKDQAWHLETVVLTKGRNRRRRLCMLNDRYR